MGGLKMVHQNQKMSPMPHMYIDNGQIAKMYAGGGTVRKNFRFIRSRLFQYEPYFHGKVWMTQISCAKLRHSKTWGRGLS